ncbi:uncharacterized protein CDV56_105659 [Aspergillus thermomutatus]|uniref:Nucleoside phosphorylase domain-containing protein n=1 Tax=Aspergillus thermomutatus TaxID=41047 RepID=A0A397GBR9_ASPTH|nr:uncharacterized protein CDV56_105659 [Aspergillus thermomutatus]RHZ48411.1 hypothetical protein CDV56_105659 [Aspergillus thermomutatus]
MIRLRRPPHRRRQVPIERRLRPLADGSDQYPAVTSPSSPVTLYSSFHPPPTASYASLCTMATHNALKSPNSYGIAWIAALPIKRAAAEAMLDEEHAAPTGFARHQTDANVYTWGRVGEHNVVIASLASGVYRTTSAATTASSLLASLPSIHLGLLVGIGGGIARPDEGYDIRLGDVVVSQPRGTMGGVCQYDLMKAKSGDKRERNDFLSRPPTVLLNALTSIQADHERRDSKIPYFLQEMLEKNPKMGNFIQTHTADPYIHYGTIASGNILVKDAAARDWIIADLSEDCVCFEMEAAGLMNYFPCLVIRGICDYADSYKNDQWQRYASATAAAYAKKLLAYVPVAELQQSKRALEVLQLAQLSQRCDFTEKSLSHDLLENIRKKVGDEADGMFRWAFCQLDSLARCHHAAAMEEALESLPLNLNETYWRMIASIPTELKNDAIHLLQFLVHFKRPLKLVKAKEVIATQIENKPLGFDIKRRLLCETDVIDYCPSLVTVVHAIDTELHLAHIPVKEYLLGENHFKIPTASISITRTCLTYLTDIDGSHRVIQRDFPMARYVAELWIDQAALAQASEDIVQVTVRFLEKEATFQRWCRLYQVDGSWDNDPGPPRGSRLYYAYFIRLVATARDLIHRGADVNAQGGYYGNALQAASQ